MHLSLLNARGGPWAYVGHLTSIAFPTLGNLTKNLGPRVETFALFARRNGTKSHRPMCSSAAAILGPLAEDGNDQDDEQMIEWVACDSCAEWHHIACVEMENISKWTYTSC